MSDYYDSNYARAVTMANTVIERYPHFTNIYRWLAAALGQLGRDDEAREALEHASTSKLFEFHVRSRPHGSGPRTTNTCCAACERQVGRAEWGVARRWNRPTCLLASPLSARPSLAPPAAPRFPISRFLLAVVAIPRLRRS